MRLMRLVSISKNSRRGTVSGGKSLHIAAHSPGSVGSNGASTIVATIVASANTRAKVIVIYKNIIVKINFVYNGEIN